MTTHLKRVMFDHGSHSVLGETDAHGQTVTSILLRPDGNGPMGLYDLIHVTLGVLPGEEDKFSVRHLEFPAHKCKGWELKR